MEVRVLGPLELVVGGAPVRLPAKQRRLLAALAIRAGETCSADLLIDAVWGEAPPASASNLLQVYISQLRKALPSPALIATSSSGYGLEVADESLDAKRFERLLKEGREAMSDGNPALAASLLRRARALWRGQAYSEFAYDEFARAEAERLEELHLVCLEERLHAELALGRHAELLPELHSLATDHPLRERLQAQAMLALYRCGRQTEALELYAGTRARLREELGLEPGDELRQLQRRILQHDPGLAVAASAAEPLHALPAPPNALVGRERELEELRGLLLRDDVRLVVLTGPGGSGKTRLALEAARETAPSFANGAAIVDLTPLRDPALVVSAISQALGVPEAPGAPLDVLAAALHPRELLLVVDNAEHLGAAAPVFVELLARARRLTVLVTSRVVLHLSGEHVYPVEPLAERDAVMLFRARAREGEPRFRPDTEDEQAIHAICERLDGLPLAIELAASRIRTLTPAELLTRLERRLPLLTGGARDLPARQQTLRATLAWSFDLLDENERRDLCRLPVFVGGSTLEAAEAVCGCAIERLASLVDHNLLRRTTTPTGSRYSMLETIREFAIERLEASGEPAELLDRHAQYFLELAELAEQELHGPSKASWLARLEADYPNVRRAIDRFGVEGRRIEQARLIGALHQFWFDRGYSTEVPTLVEEALAFELPAEVRATVLRSGYNVVGRHGDSRRADEWAHEGLELSRAIGDVSGVVTALIWLGRNALGRDDLEAAERWLSESVAAARESESDKVINPAYPLMNLARVATHQGDYDRARALLEDALEVVGREDVYGRAAIAGFLAQNEEAAGQHERAADFLRASIQMFAETGTRAALPWAIGSLAGMLTRMGDAERAARLIGAAEAEECSLYGPAVLDASAATIRTLNPREEAVFAAAVSETRAALAEDTFERLREEGRRLTIDELLRVAQGTDG